MTTAQLSQVISEDLTYIGIILGVIAVLAAVLVIQGFMKGHLSMEPGTGLRPDQYPPWPWRELNDLSEQLYAQLLTETKAIMSASGENPGNRELLKVRCGQVAYGIISRAEGRWLT
jgi:hypothetical protein